MGEAEATRFHEDDRTRVTRWSFAGAGDSTGEHVHEFDYIVVPVTGGTLRVVDADGAVRIMEQHASEPNVGSAGTHHSVISDSDRPVASVELKRQ